MQACLHKGTHPIKIFIVLAFYLCWKRPLNISTTAQAPLPCRGKMSNLFKSYLDMDMPSGYLDMDVNFFLNGSLTDSHSFPLILTTTLGGLLLPFYTRKAWDSGSLGNLPNFKHPESVPRPDPKANILSSISHCFSETREQRRVPLLQCAQTQPKRLDCYMTLTPSWGRRTQQYLSIKFH